MYNKQKVLVTLPYEIVIERTNDLLSFDIGRESTNDIAEAVVLLNKAINDNDPIWDIIISEKDRYNVEPIRCLYWLSGGDNEWETNKHYKKSWSVYYDIFNNKFKNKIMFIINNSNTLRDVKRKFEENFNLIQMYEFSIENGLIK